MKTWEMIKMLSENPKLRFKNIRDNGEIETIVYITKTGNFYADVKLNGYMVDCEKPRCNFFGNYKLTEDWQLVRDPVPVWEAIKAYTEGKTISCENINGCCSSARVKCSFSLNGVTQVRTSCLTNGNWYIDN